ncbi:MAG: hypothetical protein ACTSVI_13555 [Promethearchaeota archaeon]
MIGTEKKSHYLRLLEKTFKEENETKKSIEATSYLINKLVDVVLKFTSDNPNIKIEEITTDTIKEIKVKGDKPRNISIMKIRLVKEA